MMQSQRLIKYSAGQPAPISSRLKNHRLSLPTLLSSLVIPCFLFSISSIFLSIPIAFDTSPDLIFSKCAIFSSGVASRNACFAYQYCLVSFWSMMLRRREIKRELERGSYRSVFLSYFQPGAVPGSCCCDGGDGACPDHSSDFLL
jgi:hypothetical protein